MLGRPAEPEHHSTEVNIYKTTTLLQREKNVILPLQTQVHSCAGKMYTSHWSTSAPSHLLLLPFVHLSLIPTRGHEPATSPG